VKEKKDLREKEKCERGIYVTVEKKRKIKRKRNKRNPSIILLLLL